MSFRTVALTALLALSSPALAHDFSAGAIKVGHPWSRPTPAAAPVASGYVTLENTGKSADRLISATSPIASKVEFHRSVVEDGIAKMRPLENVVVEAGAKVDFEADRLHLMFMEPAQQLKDGDRFPATLVFEKAGSVSVEFVVQRKPAKAPEADHTGHVMK